MRIPLVTLLLVGLAVAGRPDTTRGVIDDWPLQEASEVRLDADVTIAAVTPEGEESPSICILGPIRRLGPARRDVQLPRHWLWIAEAQRGFDFKKGAGLQGLSIHFAQDLRDTTPLAQLTDLRYLAIRNSPLLDVAPLVGLKELAGLDLENSRNLVDIGPLIESKKLRALNLSGCMQVSNESLAALAKLPELRWLGLEQTRADDALMKKLPKTLRVIHLRGTSVGDKGLAALAKRCPDLRAIGLESCAVTDKGVGALKGLKQLEALDLGLTRATSRSLKTIGRFKELRSLSLDGIRLPSKSVQGWKGNPKLETLSLQDTAVSDAGLKAIAKRKALRHLELKGPDLTDKGVSALKSLTAMERLYLHHAANVTEKGLAPVIPALPNLKTLGLRRTQVRDETLALVADLKHLDWLDLGLCGWISDAGLDHLHRCTSLRQVRLDGCRQLTPAAVDRLRKALPNARIGDPNRMMGGPVPARPFPR